MNTHNHLTKARRYGAAGAMGRVALRLGSRRARRRPVPCASRAGAGAGDVVPRSPAALPAMAAVPNAGESHGRASPPAYLLPGVLCCSREACPSQMSPGLRVPLVGITRVSLFPIHIVNARRPICGNRQYSPPPNGWHSHPLGNAQKIAVSQMHIFRN